MNGVHLGQNVSVTLPEYSTLLIPKPAIGHDPEPVSFIPALTTYLSRSILMLTYHVLFHIPSE
jgi:hypothetical protein